MPFGLPGGFVEGHADDNVGTGSSVVIEELTPGAGQGTKPRVVVLLGGGLPFMGAEWGFENNVITTWYPGNGTEGTQQNLGPRELPSTWEGEWNRTRLGRLPCLFTDEAGTKQEVVSPDVLRDILEDIGRAGARLRVTWTVKGTEVVGGNTSTSRVTGRNPDGSARNQIVQGSRKTKNVQSRIVREGRIKSAKFPHDRHTDIRWTIEFHWMSRGGTQDRVANVRGDQDLGTAANAVISANNAAIAAVTAKLFSVNSLVRLSSTKFTLGQLETIAATPTRLTRNFTRSITSKINDAKRIGDIADKLRSQPFAVANAMTDFARNSVAIANTFTRQMGRIPVEKQASKSKVSDLTRTSAYLGKTGEEAVLIARRSQELDGSIKRTVGGGGNRGEVSIKESATTRQGDLVAIHICKTGDTPQSLSLKFYKSPDHGLEILRANRLPWFTPTFRPGQIVVIPVLNNALGSV